MLYRLFLCVKYLHKKKMFENWRDDLIYNTTDLIFFCSICSFFCCHHLPFALGLRELNNCTNKIWLFELESLSSSKLYLCNSFIKNTSAINNVRISNQTWNKEFTFMLLLLPFIVLLISLMHIERLSVSSTLPHLCYFLKNIA